MRRKLALATALFLVSVFIGSLVPTPPVAVDSQTYRLTQLQDARPYLETVSPNQLLSSNVQVEVSEADINARFTGMLLHLKWLIAQEKSAGGIDRALFDKQVGSILDDINESNDDNDDLDELLDGGTFDNSVLTNPVFNGPIASNMALGPRYVSGDGDDEGIAIDSGGNVQFTGGLRDTSGDVGTSGYIFISTGSGTSWVATSSLGLTASATPLTNDDVTPDFVASAGQADEYCLTYEATGSTWEWQTCGSGGGFATSSIDISAELAAIVGDETGSGALVFADSPTLSGILSAASANFSGNVGIGTTTPAAKFEIAGNNYPYAYITDTGNTEAGIYIRRDQVGGSTYDNGWYMYMNPSSKDLSFYDDQSADDVFTIKSGSGNVGIGTTSPNAKLTVHGSINISDTTAGVQFNGTRYLHASTTNDSVALGEFAGTSFNSNTTYNLAFGYEAGRQMNNTNADYMVMIGYQAGYQNTGDHTSIVGFGAGYQNSGDYTIIAGPSAGLANTGDYNTLFGAFAGRNNTGGFNNFIGHSVGFQNTGNYNNAIGYYAGYNNTGSYNDLMGYQAGRYLLSSSSVAIGGEALYGSHATNFYAANNVAIGYRAGYAADDGAANNILIGYQAADNITTGNNNIIIGYDIDDVSATADNRLNIGNLIFGTGLDGTGTTLSSGNVGIGTSTPASKLHIYGTDEVTGVTIDNNAGSGAWHGGGFDVNTYNVTGANQSAGWFALTSHRGAKGSESALQSGDDIGGYFFQGSTDVGTIGTGGYIYSEATGNWSGTSAPANMTFYTTPSGSLTSLQRMIITSAGNVGIGTTTPAQKLQVFGNVRVGTTGSNGCLENFGGGVIGGTCSSDEQLKDNIEPIAREGRSYIESIAALTAVSYNWNQNAAEMYSKDKDITNIGLIAQDVEAQFPELVSLNDDGYRQIDFTSLQFYVIEALKELWAKVQGHDERLEDLERENDYLKERIETIEDELNIEPAPAPIPPPEPNQGITEPIVDESGVTEESPESSEETDVVIEPEAPEPTYVLVPAAAPEEIPPSGE